ncbi:MAG: hypothetical protein V4594_15830 [Bacteroidota bacterium]
MKFKLYLSLKTLRKKTSEPNVSDTYSLQQGMSANFSKRYE